MIEISAKTKQLGIIGYPVEHSFSPKMHNYISEKLGNDYVYCGWEVTPDRLEAAVNGMRALNIRGINVTAPHKIEVMKYIDKISDNAALLGSVNTVVNENGVLTGYNTDADGFCMSLEYEGISLKDKDVLVIGAGGVSRPACIKMLQRGIKSLTVINRTRSKAEKIAGDIKNIMDKDVCTDIRKSRYDIVVNTTSAGMEPQENVCPVENMDFIDKDTVVADMIYNPPKTLFMKKAEERGAKTVNGLGMLICQGIIAYKLFTGSDVGRDMYKIIKQELFLQ